ncbi:MAG: DUF86 domain-containing protein [Lewinellaceae bacterium]|nr:DUF86 domain-containing protein [Phaeodactylibacter sp.]MCB0612529.1 DUF86 domain-containing protein [Phaeodactylibacter sp.]MCB9351345.1 DUF86 domain-containing protein [Lewinellaceae bacterium]
MRRKPQDKERLEHILEAANNIQEFTEGVSYEEYLQNKVLQYAIVKNFEIIGEAAHHLTKELKEKTKDKIEWRKITAFRHILVHDYWMIDFETVWNSKETKLDSLIEEVEKVIAGL